MKKAAFTLKVFGLYMNLIGLSLMVVPNLMLSLFMITPTSEVWIRVCGVLVFNLGIYYWFAAKLEDKSFMQASVFCRFFVFVSFIAFTVLGFASPMLMLIGGVDAAGAVWTWIAMKRVKGF
jgi:hypothetical protein